MRPSLARAARWIAGGVLAILAVGLVSRIGLEPKFEGRTASDWVKLLVRDQPDARRALLALGPAAVPALTRAVEARRIPVTPFLQTLRPWLPRFVRRHVLFSSPQEKSLRCDRAVELLFCLGSNAAPAVPALIMDDLNRESWEFNYAHAALLKIGEAGVPQLNRVLRNADPRARVAAARYLGEVGPGAATAAAALERAVADPDALVRSEAVTALGRIGPAARTSLPALKAALDDADIDFRLRVIETMWRVSRESESTVPMLIRILQDQTNSNRAQAAIVLGQMGSAAVAARTTLISVQEEQFSYAQVKAAEALRDIEQSTRGETRAKR